jgi:predicted Rossmann fold nucleotide-binding protein DprA/Smf involved in DNA uptake
MPATFHSGLKNISMDIKAQLGNSELLKLKKTAFLCSRKITASTVLKCYDWAIAQREAGTCIISGFHSTIEKDVLRYLLKGKQPIIVALGRGLKNEVDSELKTPFEQGRILFVTPFEKKIKRVTAETAFRRNQLMIELADTIVVGYASKGGELEKLLSTIKKPIQYLTTQI